MELDPGGACGLIGLEMWQVFDRPDAESRHEPEDAPFYSGRESNKPLFLGCP